MNSPRGRLGRALHKLRAEGSLSQDDFARELGVSRVTVSQLERGRRNLTPEMALRLEKFEKDSALSWMTLWAADAVERARLEL